MDDDVRGFDEWARATARAAAGGLVQRLQNAGTPAALGGEGQAITTRPGYRSQYVTIASTRYGPISVWLYVVPAGHEYGTSSRAPQLGAGLMYDSDSVLPQDTFAFGGLGPGTPFRWRKLTGGWEGYVFLLEADIQLRPEAASDVLVSAVVRGLRAAKLAS
jgi:hypothetical protein